MRTLRFFLFLMPVILAGCGFYSLSGASVTGKNIRIQVFENRARYISPGLTASLTQRISTRILSQTGLAPVNTEDADYNLSGTVTTYEVTVTGVQNTQQASQNRLNVSVAVDFVNRKDAKGSFRQTFTRFADFPANQSIQNVEGRLVEEIGVLLADDIFNKAFVNW